MYMYNTVHSIFIWHEINFFFWRSMNINNIRSKKLPLLLNATSEVDQAKQYKVLWILDYTSFASMIYHVPVPVSIQTKQ